MTNENTPMLVSTDWLEARLDDKHILIFDCTTTMGPAGNNGFEMQYTKHHIAGAAYLDLGSPSSHFCDHGISRPYAWPNKAQLEKGLSVAGVSSEHHVILYAAPEALLGPLSLCWATRAWWLMHQAGVRCSVLDGGWDKWLKENKPVSDEETRYPETQFVAEGYDPNLIAERQDVVEVLGGGNAFLVDALSPASYSGEMDRPYTKRNGHIAGAINLPYELMLDPESSCFLPEDTLKALFEEKGYGATDDAIFYCGGGVATTVTAFAFRLAGLGTPRIYAAGLSEWANDPELPMATLV